jgi:hypothetical protein
MLRSNFPGRKKSRREGVIARLEKQLPELKGEEGAAAKKRVETELGILREKVKAQ